MPGAVKAFTLVESSIVLLVIGFLAGGVVVGRSLMHSADTKSQIAQLQAYQSAFLSFQEKYNCLPGDCPNATSNFGATDDLGYTVNNGDGNGFIDTLDKLSYDANHGSNDEWILQTELWGAFQQLALARLIDFKPINPLSPVPGNGFPILKATTNKGFFFGASYNFDAGRNPWITSLETGKNALWIVACNNQTDPMMGHWDDDCGIFTAADLQAIDLKIDDGLPLSGAILGFGGWNSNNDCLVADGSNYKTSGAGLQCQAAYLIN